MKASDASTIVFMHTGLTDWQRLIVQNIYLKKKSIFFLIFMLLALAIVLVSGFVPLGLLLATNFQIRIPTHVDLILIVSAAITAVLFLIVWSYSFKQEAVEKELIRYYGEYPKDLEKIIVDNAESLVVGGHLPPEFIKTEQELLEKSLSKPE